MIINGACLEVVGNKQTTIVLEHTTVRIAAKTQVEVTFKNENFRQRSSPGCGSVVSTVAPLGGIVIFLYIRQLMEWYLFSLEMFWESRKGLMTAH